MELLEFVDLQTLDEVDSFLGTPSAQKILRILVCWDILPIKEIKKKSGLSESQVHATIRNLQKIGIIEQESRGLYKLSLNKFPQLLKEAYLVFLNQVVGQSLYNLSKNLDNLTHEEVSKKLVFLMNQCKPILEQNYASKIASLAEYLVDTA